MKEKRSLAEEYQELAKEWHPTKNGELTPKDITSGSGKKVWWLCSKGHEWQARVADRTSGKGCPYCSGKKKALICPQNRFTGRSHGNLQ